LNFRFLFFVFGQLVPADLVSLSLSAVLRDQLPLRAIRQDSHSHSHSAAEPSRRRLGPLAPLGPQPQPQPPSLDDLRVQSHDRHALVSALSSLELPSEPASEPPPPHQPAPASAEMSVPLLAFQICSQVGYPMSLSPIQSLFLLLIALFCWFCCTLALFQCNQYQVRYPLHRIPCCDPNLPIATSSGSLDAVASHLPNFYSDALCRKPNSSHFRKYRGARSKTAPAR
jgi:hypothetical protein